MQIMFLEAVCIAAEVMGNALLDKYVLNQILIQTMELIIMIILFGVFLIFTFALLFKDGVKINNNCNKL
jgi:hypothetical protein